MSIAIMSKVFFTKFPEMPSRSIKIKDSDKLRLVNISPCVIKIIMLAIADSSDDYGQNSWNSIDRLATKTSLNRRTVIRTIEVLANNEYLILNGLSEYGTNNIEINLDKLGEPPKKRSKQGRPQNSEEIKTSGSESETSGSESETSGSESETSGSEPPDSSLSTQNHPLQNSLQTTQEEQSTPAKKNGGGMNQEEIRKTNEQAMLKGLMSGSPYAHFPERIVPVVERMERLWYFHPPANSKKKNGKYAFWVQSCGEILEACAEFGVDILDELHADWMAYLTNHGGIAPYPISSPKSLVSAVEGKARLKRSGSSAPYWAQYKDKPVKQSTLDV